MVVFEMQNILLCVEKPTLITTILVRGKTASFTFFSFNPLSTYVVSC